MSSQQQTKTKKGKRGKGKGKGGRRPRRQLYRRKRGRKTSTQNEALLTLLKPSEQDVMKLLAAQAHIGRRKAHVNMKRYIWKRRQDGIHVINLEKTWAKLMLAARILVTCKEPSDICVMSTRTYGQRGAIKFAHYTGATALVGKWVPGTFTNPQNKAFFEPRIVIVDDPSTCFAALRETSYVGIPVIALCGTDNNTRFVDCGIPCNNRGKFSIGLMFWLLARELLRMRGDPTCLRTVEWKESVDLFFYRDADEIKRQQDAKLQKQQKAARAALGGAGGGAYGGGGDDDEFGGGGGVGDDQQDDFGAGGYADDQNYDNQMGGNQNWDMPATGIEDWDGGAAPDQPQQPQQQQFDDQQQQQPQQQYDDGQQQQPQQQQYQQQQPAQGGDYQDDQGGMGMQTW